jgi:oligopeptide transport system permease protein
MSDRDERDQAKLEESDKGIGVRPPSSLITEDTEEADLEGVPEVSPAIEAPGGATGAQIAGAVGDIAPSHQASLWGDAWRQLRKNPFFILPMLLLIVFTAMAFAPGLFTSTDPRACNLRNIIVDGEQVIAGPSGEHLFGYDVQGCDYYSRVIYGTRVSLAIGLTTVFFSTVIAVVLGSLAGFYSGWIDGLIARFADIIFAIPLVLGGIIVLNSLGTRTVWTVSFGLLIFIWPTTMRLMRSSVLSLKDMDYVLAARALGANDLRILRRHILPNGWAPVIVYSTITVGITIATEATLTFLGVGLQQPAISWGLMIASAQFRILQYPHLLFFPGMFLVLMVFSFILLGDALRDALDPRLR